MLKKIYMLDTDICSYIIKENPKQLAKKFIAHEKHDLCISIITYAELHYGAIKSKSKEIIKKVKLFTGLLRIIAFDQKAAECYAVIRSELNNKGTPIGHMDLLIAASASAIDAVLVTNNTKHFKKISSINVENWKSN